MLNGKQKRYLRALGAQEKAIYQVGKEGLSLALLDGVALALKKRELIKVAILKTCDLETQEVAIEIAAGTGSEVVQIIGRTILFYKPSKEKVIKLP